MTAAIYSAYISDSYGNRLADAAGFLSLSYSRVVNDWSTATITLPGSFNPLFLQPDYLLEIWRKLPDTGREYLVTDTAWLIQAWEFDRDERGNKTIVVEADVPLALFREPGRIVDYAAGSAQADQTDNLDDICKAIIRQNAGSSASASRNLSSLLSVAPDLGMAPSKNKAFAWDSVLRTLQELAQTSAENGTYLAFDIVTTTPGQMEFRTYTGQRGVDHRWPGGQNPIILSADFGNLGAGNLRFDYRDRVSWARAGGQGDKSERVTKTAQDSDLINISPFGLREAFREATKYADDTSGGITAEAQAAVRAGRPRTLYKARLLDTPDTRWGVHWEWGDYVTAQDFGQLIDCRVDGITVTVKPAGSGQQFETVDAWLRRDT